MPLPNLPCPPGCLAASSQALDYLGSKLKVLPKYADRAKRRSKVDEARDVLSHVVLCHVPVPKYNFSSKVRKAQEAVRCWQQLLAGMAMCFHADTRKKTGAWLAGPARMRGPFTAVMAHTCMNPEALLPGPTCRLRTSR